MSFLRWTSKLFRSSPAPPLRFQSTGFAVVPVNEVLEEERFHAFQNGRYYPVHIGDIIHSKYQVTGKLGFGASSTVWLARDLQGHRNVSLKIYIRGDECEKEIETYRFLSRIKRTHRGSQHVRSALDSFMIPREGGDHCCLVQQPTWDSFRDLLYRNRSHRFSEDLLKAGLMQLFLALEFLHTEAKLVHTDIKADNILVAIEDKYILDDFVSDELQHPSPRKVVDGKTIYASRRFNIPKTFGKALLSDFGSAVKGDVDHCEDMQPDVYRSPEVMLKTNWSYPIDIWNVGVMIWDLFQGRHLFYGRDPEKKKYTTRAHLAEVVGMLGTPPLDLLRKGRRSREFFNEDGEWIAAIPIPVSSLEQSESFLSGENKAAFLRLVRGMLQWRPEDRKTATELLKDPWLNS